MLFEKTNKQTESYRYSLHFSLNIFQILQITSSFSLQVFLLLVDCMAVVNPFHWLPLLHSSEIPAFSIPKMCYTA